MFDPYHKWLAIPKEQRPPTYYQLLGVSPGEQDPEVIEEAAISRTTHLRSYQLGEHSAECTRLLNEIGQARATLLNPDKRKEYDAKLAREAAAKQAAEQAEQASRVGKGSPRPAPARDFADLDDDSDDGEERRPAPKKRRRAAAGEEIAADRSKVHLLIGVAAAVPLLLIVVGGLLFLLLPRSTPQPGPKPDNEGQPLVVGGNGKPAQAKGNPLGKPPADPVVAPKPPVAQPMAQPKAEPGMGKGKELFRFPFSLGIHSLDYAPDGSYFLAGSNSQVMMGDPKTGKIERTFEVRNPTVTLAISPDSRLALFGGSQGSLRLWDVRAGQEVRPFEGHKTGVGCVTFSSDGKYALSAGGDGVRLWEVDSRKLVKQFDGLARGASAVAFAPDGSILGSDTEELCRWNRDTGAVQRFPVWPKGLAPVPPDRSGRGAAFSPDGRLLVTVAGVASSVVSVWSTADGQHREQVPNGDVMRVGGLAWSPDSRVLFLGSGSWSVQARKNVDCVIRAWDLQGWKELYRFGETERPIGRVAVSHDGKFVAGCDYQSVRLWQVPQP